MEIRANLKQRLVGGAVLLLIGIAFFPLVFNAAGYEERRLESRIPTAPEVVRLVQTERPAPVIIEQVPVAPVTETPVVSAPVSEITESLDALRPSLNPAEEAPALDADQVPAAWALQLASFRQEANARELRTRLINAGYRVYIRQGEDVVRVFVGPEMQRSRLEELKVSLQQEYGLEGMIVRFTTQ
ncbi:MAG: SPOR domain-containing protein [Nitrincola lacisaponensis]|uniref:SPOR domain-containing protein n=1 Tax=Nitrincola lacisaponensis TaxID=267850 RepID=UPI00391B2F53